MINLRSLEDPYQRPLLLNQLREEASVVADPAALSEIQHKALSQIFNNHVQEESVPMSESEKFILHWILSSSSNRLSFPERILHDPSFTFVNFTRFYELKKIIDKLYGNALRDIERTPSILNDGRTSKPNVTLRVKTALAIIMSSAFNRPIDAHGLEIKGAMQEITKLANQLVGPILLTLVEQNEYPDIESAKKGTWATLPPQVKKRYTLLLESQVLSLFNLPISRCHNMWLANYYLNKAFHVKRVNAGTFSFLS